MNARGSRAMPPGRVRLLGAGAPWLAPALLVLVGLAATVAGFVWFAQADIRVYAYRNAPACGAAAHRPGTDCVRHETGRVTAKDVHPGAGPGSADPEGGHTVTVARRAAPARGYEVAEAFYDRVRIGADVDLTVFRGRVAALTYEGHRQDNLDVSYLVSFGVPFLTALGSALVTHGLTWSRLGPGLTRFAGAGGPVLALAFISSLTFVSVPMPPALLLVLPILLWLTATAAATAITWDF
ncbi:hypothetical protein ACFVFS_11435 [Kitasatospora sp. NPDC057692]|uniref:hypothetical protein n=1 Tax=Kitasatospora sp. NPDC057692 TaxID=3346215 RepID=UPI0036BFDE05